MRAPFSSVRNTTAGSAATRRLMRARHVSSVFTGLTGAAAWLILAMFVVLVLHIAWGGRSHFGWRFLTTGAEGTIGPETSGVLPMLIGTTARVLLMTLLVMPAGVLTAIYLSEYTGKNSKFARLIRSAVTNLAGVPSILFGLFGLGFFVAFVGGSMDELLGGAGVEPHWGKPGLLWASATLAVMTLPVVIVATEEALRAVPQSLREASLSLGATRLETVLRIVLPQAMPGIATGAILAISRAAGEVAPILFTGAAYYMARLPQSLTDQFMDLGYHAFVLATQTPDLDATRPILYATVFTLLCLTLALNILAMFIRARVRSSILPDQG